MIQYEKHRRVNRDFPIGRKDIKQIMEELFIKSSQFEYNGWIPDCCAGYGNDKSPELHIEGLPAETVTLAIVMDDLDHPIQPGFNHWVAWNITPVNRIP